MSPRWLGLVPVAALLGVLFGRYTAQPPTVHDETHATTDTKATVATVAHAEEAKHETATRDTDTTVRTVTRWLPSVAAAGGCPAVPAHVEQEVVRETRIEAARTADTHRVQQVQQHAETEAHQSVVTLHTIESRPNWSVSVLAGIQDGGKRLVDALPAPAVVGVVVERRILGPVSIGAWGTTARAAGLSLRVDF